MNSHNQNSGAKFVRADLHIHSFGKGKKGSFDVDDAQMTPANIVDTAIEKGLSIISITDHNEINNVELAIDYAAEKNICVIPGIEVSTLQGHLLVYFETLTQLQKFFKQLDISEDQESCNQGIVECLDHAEKYGGFGILAHIELSSGFEKTIGRFDPKMEKIISHKALLGMEISNKASFDFYSDRDANEERRRMLSIRKEKLGLPSDYEIPKTMSSDSHKLVALGKNAEGENRLTRIKVDSPSFHGLKVALLNAQSRVRIEDFIPKEVPRFTKLEISGGLFGDATIEFNNNLNCIIGGRGAGKSTILEAIRECSGNVGTPRGRMVDSEVWPDAIRLSYIDETGQEIIFRREKHDLVTNTSDPIEGIVKVGIESYGQGETAETLQHSEQNPQALLNFLDNFINVDSLKTEDAEICELLRNNQSEQTRLTVEVKGIPDTKSEKKNLEQKLEHLRTENVKDLVDLQTALIQEREIRKKIKTDLDSIRNSFNKIFSDKAVFNEFAQQKEEQIIVGKTEFKNVKDLVAGFASVVDLTYDELNKSLTEKIIELDRELAAWEEKEGAIQTKIDKKRAELEAKGIPFDLGKIKQINNDLIYQKKRLQDLQAKEEDLKKLKKERAELIKKRVHVKNRIFQYRRIFARSTNDNLKSSVDGFFVAVKYSEGTLSFEFEESLKSIMGWRTNQVPRAKYIAKALSPIKFVEIVNRGNRAALTNITNDDGERVLSDSEIENIFSRVKENRNFEDLESIPFEDMPSVIVTKEVTTDSGEVKKISRPISKLSLGQQQSILLAILIQSDSRKPLIIDQPEDNLDSEFIFKTVVSNLTKIKERRQVIIVTHNPNIAVLGDAELIIPLKSTSIKSHIIDRGSVDRSETRKLCCEILEGGEQAFAKRQQIYGI